jgi:hypothetical protein
LVTRQSEYFSIKNAITSQVKKIGVDSKGVFDLKEYVSHFSELVKTQEKNFQKPKDGKDFQKKPGNKK